MRCRRREEPISALARNEKGKEKVNPPDLQALLRDLANDELAANNGGEDPR